MAPVAVEAAATIVCFPFLFYLVDHNMTLSEQPTINCTSTFNTTTETPVKNDTFRDWGTVNFTPLLSLVKDKFKKDHEIGLVPYGG